MSIFSFTAISAALISGRYKLQWKKAVFYFSLIILILVVLLAGLNFAFSHLLADTYHGSNIVSSIELPRDSHGVRPDEMVSTKVDFFWSDSLSDASWNDSLSAAS